MRSVLFGVVYVTLVYAAAPVRNASDECFVCVMRAASASVWVLAGSSWLLLLAPVQVCVILFSRLAEDESGVDSHIEFAPLSGAQTPDRHIGDVHGCIVDVKDAGARLAVAHEGASVPLPPSNGLRFHLAQPVENATAHLEAGKHLNKDGFAMSTAMLHAIAQREFEK